MMMLLLLDKLHTHDHTYTGGIWMDEEGRRGKRESDELIMCSCLAAVPFHQVHDYDFWTKGSHSSRFVSFQSCLLLLLPPPPPPAPGVLYIFACAFKTYLLLLFLFLYKIKITTRENTVL